MAVIGITVLKRNAPWGPFTREQIEEALKRGDFTVNYLAHAPGMREWLPLGEVLDYIAHHRDAPESALPKVPFAPSLPPIPPLSGGLESPPPVSTPIPDRLTQMSTRPTSPPPQTRPPILPPPRPPPSPALEQVSPLPAPAMPKPEVKGDPKPIAEAREPAVTLDIAPMSARVIAFLVDGAILFLPVLVLTVLGALCIEIPAAIRHINHQSRMEEWDLLALNDRRLSWLIIGLGWLYGAAFEGSTAGATLGKKWLGLKVVDAQGEHLGFFRAVGRNLSKFLSGGIFFIGFIMAFFGTRHLALHDWMSDSRVVRR